jgi:hypothetical protein
LEPPAAGLNSRRSTLNSNLSDTEKDYLYESGLKAARQFFATSRVAENSYGEQPGTKPATPR